MRGEYLGTLKGATSRSISDIPQVMSSVTIADRMNAHSSSIAVNAIIQLYRSAEDQCLQGQRLVRAHELHRNILVFSISLDHDKVRIYGHYASIRKRTTFHRHLIRSVKLADGKDRWIAYNFVRMVYDVFVPIHLKRIRDAISHLPEQHSGSSMSPSALSSDWN